MHIHESLILRSRVSALLTLDKNSVDREGYRIRSLYFDGVHRQALEDKAAGIFSREKYRIRIYNGSDRTIKLERKSKFGEFIHKESVGLTREEYERIMLGDIAFLQERRDPLVRDFYVALAHRGFKPAVIVEYVREAYTYPGDVRVTFDKKLSAGVNGWHLFDPNLMLVEVLANNVTIMEIKYDGFFPEAVRALMQPESHQRSAISKYLLSREVALRHFIP